MRALAGVALVLALAAAAHAQLNVCAAVLCPAGHQCVVRAGSPYCLFVQTKTQACPTGCKTYTYGCDSCTCDENGAAVACTDVQCVWEGIPKCLAKFDDEQPTQEPTDKPTDKPTPKVVTCDDKPCNADKEVCVPRRIACEADADMCNAYQCVPGPAPTGAIWSDCASACPPTCERPEPSMCLAMCRPGWVCKERGLLIYEGRCIKPDECPSTTQKVSTTTQKPSTTTQKPSTTTQKPSTPKCNELLCDVFCPNGHVLDENGCKTCSCIQDKPVCPKGCKTYFDGCNTCMCNADGSAACTKKMCLRQEEPYCMDSTEQPTKPPTQCPKDCKVYFDGCNRCMCGPDGAMACTEMFCAETKEPYCMDTTEPTKPPTTPSTQCPQDCKVFFDGCNTCACMENGQMACTKMFCQVYQDSYCKDTTKPSEEPTKPTEPTRPPMKCPKNCESYYDGCNTCSCAEDGTMQACTEMACFTMGEPKCLREFEEASTSTTAKPLWRTCEDKPCKEDEICTGRRIPCVEGQPCDMFMCSPKPTEATEASSTSTTAAARPCESNPCRGDNQVCVPRPCSGANDADCLPYKCVPGPRPDGAIWSECGSACPPSCEAKGPIDCIMMCVPSWVCANRGHLMHEGRCIDPAECPTEKPTERTTEKTTEKPTERTTEKTTEKPTERTTERTTEKTTERTTEKPTERTTEKTEKPTERTTEKTEKPTERTTEKTEKPTERTTEKTEKPTERSTERTTEKTEKPTERSTERTTEQTPSPTDKPTPTKKATTTTASTAAPTTRTQPIKPGRGRAVVRFLLRIQAASFNAEALEQQLRAMLMLTSDDTIIIRLISDPRRNTVTVEVTIETASDGADDMADSVNSQSSLDVVSAASVNKNEGSDSSKSNTAVVAGAVVAGVALVALLAVLVVLRNRKSRYSVDDLNRNSPTQAFYNPMYATTAGARGSNDVAYA